MNAQEFALLLAVLEAEVVGMWSDDPACAWCGEVVPDGLGAWAPYCSAACREAAALEDGGPAGGRAIARAADGGEEPEA